MAPLETGDGPSSALSPPGSCRGFPGRRRESAEERSPRVNGMFALKTSWSQQDVDKLEQVQRGASRVMKGREDWFMGRDESGPTRLSCLLRGTNLGETRGGFTHLSEV